MGEPSERGGGDEPGARSLVRRGPPRSRRFSPPPARGVGGRVKRRRLRARRRADLRSENARQGTDAPLSATPSGSSSVRKAGRSSAATSISPPSPPSIPLSLWPPPPHTRLSNSPP